MKMFFQNLGRQSEWESHNQQRSRAGPEYDFFIMVNYGCHINLFCIAPLCFDEIIDGDAVAKYILVASTFPQIGLHRRANRDRLYENCLKPRTMFGIKCFQKWVNLVQKFMLQIIFYSYRFVFTKFRCCCSLDECT